MRDALHHAAVADEHIGMMIDDGVAGPIEGGRERALRQRHAHRIGEALAERAGGGLDAEVHLALRVTRGLGAELPKILELLDRQGIAGQMQHGIQQHRCVAVRQHEAVAVPPSRIARIELKHVAPQHFGDVRHAHGRARMARIGLLDGIHRKGTNGVGELAAGGHVGISSKLRKAGYCPRCALRQQIGIRKSRFGGEHVHTIAVSVCIAPIGRRHDPVHRRAAEALLRFPDHAIFYKSPILTCTATPPAGCAAWRPIRRCAACSMMRSRRCRTIRRCW